MIIQCEACETRFRLADEKIKPGGTKVRCSKCKEIFSVAPPEPEPAEETVDFRAFNMEAVPEEQPGEAAATADSPTEEASAPQDEPAPATEAEQDSEAAEEAQCAGTPDDELDFSGLEEQMDDAGTAEEVAEEFSFAEASQPDESDATSPDADSGTAEEAGEPGDAIEFEFDDDSATTGEEASTEPAATEEEGAAAEFTLDTADDEETETSEFAFAEDAEDTAAPADEEPADFDFGDQEEDNAFSLDDESPGESGTAAEWDEDSPAGDTFDFDEPRFDSDTSESESASGDAAEAGMQFGEIDFSSDETDSATPGFQTEDTFATATIESQNEPEPFTPREQTPPPSREDGDEEPLPVPPPPKKSSLSRILLLLILLLVVLGGAAGFLFMQEGSLNLNAVTQYLPFLKDYVGGPEEAAGGDRIGINISGSTYVNGQAGQMLVIQGSAVNNYTGNRSSIVIKGTLLDAQGKALRQQTVFCGNALGDAELAKMPFSAIEEAMNNEFGDSLSNINIATGASIPFTIVFRNLPGGIANINVEVVDSKPGGS